MLTLLCKRKFIVARVHCNVWTDRDRVERACASARVCDRACTIFLTHSVAQRGPSTTFPRPDARWLECKLYAVPHDCVASRRVHHKYISAIPCTVILYLRANAFGCRARRRPRGFSGLMLSGIFCVAFALIDCGRRREK